MKFFDLVNATRSCRRFDASQPLGMDALEKLVDLARRTASAGNLQPLQYALCCEPAMNEAVFATLGWAAYLPDWPGPAAAEQPTGYIVIGNNEHIVDKLICDHGIAAQTIMLGATEMGLGGCILGSVNREKLSKALDLPEKLRILLVLALGVPAETCVLEPLGPEGSIKYYRDDQGVHHVPKRSLDEIIVARFA